MGELLLDEVGKEGLMGGGMWSIEKRFRVTEVFLAVLWVGGFPSCLDEGRKEDGS